MILSASKCPDVELPMRLHAKVCQFCGAPVMLRVFDEAFRLFKADIWWDWAACDKCADYKVEMLRLRDMLSRLGSRLVVAKATSKEQYARSKVDVETAAEAVTRQAFRACCDYYGLVNYYDAEPMRNFMEQPNKAWAIFNHVWKHMEQAARDTLGKDVPRLSERTRRKAKE